MLRGMLLLIVPLEGLPASAWVLQATAPLAVRGPPAFRFVNNYHRNSFLFSSSDILDVEFERVNPENATSEERSQGIHLNALGEETTKSLFDLSIEADPEFANSRIPFLDYGGGGANAKDGGTNYIDVKMAFMADLDGAQYGIGVPFDPAVAVTLEKSDGSVEYLSPDTEDNEELMEIMAVQLHEHVGADLKLQKTPRVLTVVGPLDNYTKNWREKILPDPVPAEDLMDTSDESLDFFHKFMRQELGDEEYEKTMNEEDDDDELPPDLLELFEVPGLGDLNDESEASMKEVMESLLSPEKDFENAKESLGLNSLDHEGVALKLISYVFAEGKSYSLVKLLRPYILVGRFVPDENDPRFELLDSEEEKIVLPRLEKVCKADLERAGFANLTN